MTTTPGSTPGEASGLPPALAAQIERFEKEVSEGISELHDSMKLNIPNGFFDSFKPADSKYGAWISDWIRNAQPSNWPEDAYRSYETIKEVLETDGIPIVHVPRAEIVAQLFGETSFDDRMRIIEDRADDIAHDCGAALPGKFHSEIEKQGPLALEAIESYVAGRYASAQALAVAVCDTYLKTYLGGRYKAMIETVKLEKADDLPAQFAFNFSYAFGPVASFLTEWFPDGNTAPPTKLSRHVSIHNASTDHMTKLNATIAIMLVTSLTVAIDKAERSRDERSLGS